MEDKAMEVKAENTEKTKWEFRKNVPEYGDSANNYSIPHELTVTITLREYRSLLTQAADAKVIKYNHDWCEEHEKNKELQDKVDELKDTIRDLEEAIKELKGEENDG